MNIHPRHIISRPLIQYPHKVWKHGECFRASNTAAHGPKCLPFLRDNSRLSNCLTEKKVRGVEMEGKKGAYTGQKIKTVFNLQLTTLNRTRKI
jgi:hypothetical protein